jgi:hypothetical protein
MSFGLSDFHDMGVFGNVWIRAHKYDNKGDTHPGHLHHFDHVTIVMTGGVLCEVEGEEPKEFWAPTFIVIAKDKRHKFTALADKTTYYCVFALRDKEGQVTDVYTGDHSPYGGRHQTRAEVEAELAPTCIACNGCEVADQLRTKMETAIP